MGAYEDRIASIIAEVQAAEQELLAVIAESEEIESYSWWDTHRKTFAHTLKYGMRGTVDNFLKPMGTFFIPGLFWPAVMILKALGMEVAGDWLTLALLSVLFGTVSAWSVMFAGMMFGIVPTQSLWYGVNLAVIPGLFCIPALFIWGTWPLHLSAAGFDATLAATVLATLMLVVLRFVGKYRENWPDVPGVLRRNRERQLKLERYLESAYQSDTVRKGLGI